ncbi:hypothetical protein IEU95_09815 [Hoyosella rhizosphaerae]|uniref:Uncharacterized protein n=1 Tax=Hoyosella rhizosphaerae TaxID=1755582 RepID=A0A916TZA9_9ACTN|nr:hypothetical protein [Hoyosella rhizosphaerae]MBN4927129.1 hypothetical protein [Hoyosella rhizosphaerae]GGC53751.1 hypothetical protein GCM10011410_02670 [Hoyosella rhizosphaerae]
MTQVATAQVSAPHLTPKPLSPATRVARMSVFELKHTFRQKLVLAMLALGPVCALIFASTLDSSAPEAWASMLATTGPVLILISVTSALAIVIAVRRETEMFKVLRATELGPTQMMAALVVPYLVIGFAVGALIIGGFIAIGAPMPANWFYLGAGLIGTVALSIVGGIATGAFSTSAASVQFTTIPILIVSIGFPVAALQGLLDESVRSWLLLGPFSGVADLLARGMGAELVQAPASLGLSAVALDVVSTLVWIAAGVWFAKATWQWGPRS